MTTAAVAVDLAVPSGAPPSSQVAVRRTTPAESWKAWAAASSEKKMDRPGVVPAAASFLDSTSAALAGSVRRSPQEEALGWHLVSAWSFRPQRVGPLSEQVEAETFPYQGQGHPRQLPVEMVMGLTLSAHKGSLQRFHCYKAQLHQVRRHKIHHHRAHHHRVRWSKVHHRTSRYTSRRMAQRNAD